MRRSVLAAGAAIVVVAAAAGAFGLHALGQSQRATALCSKIEQLNRSRHDTSPVTRGSSVTVVLGDSYAQGWELSTPRDSWPRAYGVATKQTVYVNAVAGSGLTRSTYCPGQTFASRVRMVRAHHPATVIVQTGLNDVGASSAEIKGDLAAVARKLGPTRLIVVGAPYAPERPRRQVQAVNAALRDEARHLGATYVDLTDLRLHYLPDRLHTDQAGQDAIGRAIAAVTR